MDTTKTDKRKPRIENAPGLTWDIPKTGGLIARWKAATPIRERGFKPASARIWSGEWPTPTECLYIATQCQRLQSEMHVWNRGGLPPALNNNIQTIKDLIERYQTDPDSPYVKKIRHSSKLSYTAFLRRINRDRGGELIANIKSRDLIRWHEHWLGEERKVYMAHALMTMVRGLASFGESILEDDGCKELMSKLRKLEFEVGKGRKEQVTAEQVILIRAKAHEMGRPSIALAQAIQFEVMLRQRDVIGEWVPVEEKHTEPTEIIDGHRKWVRGIRWTEIDHKLVLLHTTSKRGKEIEFDLKSAPMVMEEFQRCFGGALPASGPVIIDEATGRPYDHAWFRRLWRGIANAAGIPAHVFNMDSRAGAISEGAVAGALPGHLQQSATHSDPKTTLRYTRSYKEMAKNVSQLRVGHRAKKAGNLTDTD